MEGTIRSAEENFGTRLKTEGCKGKAITLNAKLK
jgi:hypothetical protein